MHHLDALISHGRDMLAEIENDPHAYFSEMSLREVIDDDNWAMLLAEKQQLDDLRELRKEKEGWCDFAKTLPAATGHNSRLLQARHFVEQQRRRLAHWEKKRVEAEHFIEIHNRAIANQLGVMGTSWEALSDRERAAFARMPKQVFDVFDFPMLVSPERALFYPEATASRIVVMERLRHVLGVMERELEANKPADDT